MIAHLAGTVRALHPTFLVLDVGGVGYRVYATTRFLTTLTPTSDCALHTHLVVREDAQELFGFPTYAELELFELLIGVSGIGPRSALAIIGLESIERLGSAIAHGDVGYLTKVSGVGKKSAEKIVLELKDKMGTLADTETAIDTQGEEDALEALRALGYRTEEAREALRHVPAETRDTGERVKAALQQLTRAT